MFESSSVLNSGSLKENRHKRNCVDPENEKKEVINYQRKKNTLLSFTSAALPWWNSFTHWMIKFQSVTQEMQCMVPCRLQHQLALHNVLSSPLQAAGLSASLNSGPAGYETSFSAAEKPKPVVSTSRLESWSCWKPEVHGSKAKRKWSCHHRLPLLLIEKIPWHFPHTSTLLVSCQHCVKPKWSQVTSHLLWLLFFI